MTRIDVPGVGLPSVPPLVIQTLDSPASVPTRAKGELETLPFGTPRSMGARVELGRRRSSYP